MPLVNDEVECLCNIACTKEMVLDVVHISNLPECILFSVVYGYCLVSSSPLFTQLQLCGRVELWTKAL